MIDSSRFKFSPWQCELKNWCLIKVNGPDAAQFLHGQLTQDIKKIAPFESAMSARLNSTGRIQSFFIVINNDKNFLLLVLKDLANKVLEDLNKFIIMDDVEMEKSDENLFFSYMSHSEENKKIKINFMGFEGFLNSTLLENIDVVNEDAIAGIGLLNGFPFLNETINEGQLLNETYLNVIGVSYKKGCFLGQETVAKIENNRGAATFPMYLEIQNEIELPEQADIYRDNSKIGTGFKLIEIDGKKIIYCKLSRQARVEDRLDDFVINNKGFKAKIKNIPYFKSSSQIDLAHELYDMSLKTFHAGNIEEALKLIDKSIQCYPYNDNIEIKGVMLGRLERFEEAIKCMDMLTEIDPKSVMAHTNKSLFLMRLGKITEAEEEKSLATVKSFEKFGEEAKAKKQIEEQKKQKIEELMKREKMFMQVLDIDQEDVVANFGMADIEYNKGKYIDALNYVLQALKTDPNYSQGYLLKGKVEEALLDPDSAKETYAKGIEVATKKGEMMPANEMQSRLNSL